MCFFGKISFYKSFNLFENVLVKTFKSCKSFQELPILKKKKKLDEKKRKLDDVQDEEDLAQGVVHRLK